MITTKVESPTQGLVGYMHGIELQKDTVIIFQLPRKTQNLTTAYIDNAMEMAKACLPAGRTALVIGSDVNLYEVAGADISILKLKGIFNTN